MTTPTEKPGPVEERYQSVFNDVAGLIDAARRSAARSVNAVMTAAYWLIGRYIVEFEQRAKSRAEYRAALIERLAADLTKRFGRGSRARTWSCWHRQSTAHGRRLARAACCLGRKRKPRRGRSGNAGKDARKGGR